MACVDEGAYPEPPCRQGRYIVYPEPTQIPSISQALAMEQGRLARGRPDEDLTRTSQRETQCTCGLDAALEQHDETH